MTTTEILTGIKDWVLSKLSLKQDVINDLATIRSGAQAGTTAVQPSDLSEYFNDASYDTSTHRINFYHGQNIVAYVDASPFIVDGMVDDVRIENGYLVIDFNTESGKQDISIPLTDIFDPSNYYNKTQTDALLGNKVDKVSGKGLSTNDYTNTEKEKLSGLQNYDDTQVRQLITQTNANFANYYTKAESYSAAEVDVALGGKQNTINDLDTIRSGASAGATAVQPDTLNSALSNAVAESGVYDVTANNNNAKFASLSALLSSENLNTLIPSAKRKGGMSIKFVQSSDNKYVQYRFLLSGSFTDAQFIDTENWAITTEYIITDNPEYIKVVLGDDDSIIYAVKPNGDIIFGVGVPSEIRAYILTQIESAVEGKVDKVNGKGLSTNDFTDSLQAKLNALPTAEGLSMLFAEKVSKEEDKGIVPLQYFKEVDDFRYVKAVTDAEDNLLLAIDKNGYFVFGAGVPPQIVNYIASLLDAKVDKEAGKSLISEEYATSVEIIDDPEWMQVTTDNTGNIIEGIKKDGSKYIAKLEGLKKESDIADYDFVKKQEGVNVEKRLIPYTVSTDADVVNYNTHYNSLIIAFMTDTHIDLGDTEASRNNLIDTVNYVNNLHVPVAAILNGGDLLTPTANSSEIRAAELRDIFALVNDSRIPFLYTKGNHDLNAISVSPSDVVTDDQWGDVYFNRAETEYGIVRKTKLNGKKSGYYYYDVPNFKVRIVCADCYDIDFSVLNDRGRILYTPGDASYIANEQFNWIANTALNFDDKDEKDWGVLVFMHFYKASDVWGTSYEPKFKSVYPAFNNMLAALNSQTDFSEQYTFTDNSFFDLDVSANFSRYANLEKKPYVIGVICGHLHLDINYAKDGIQNIFTANQFCEIAESLTDQRVNRIAGTTTQNLFDLFAIDLHNKKIRAIRYGAGVNCYGNGGDRFLPNGLSF